MDPRCNEYYLKVLQQSNRSCLRIAEDSLKGPGFSASFCEGQRLASLSVLTHEGSLTSWKDARKRQIDMYTLLVIH